MSVIGPPARSNVTSKLDRARGYLKRYRVLRYLNRALRSARDRFQSEGTRSRLEARAYVATNRVSGSVQLEILKREGLQPSSHVLEVGCGALHAGIPLMRFLQPDHFVGIDPNAWLRESQMQRRVVRRLVAKKRPRFLSRDDFDAGEVGRQFDYVLAHSILSHAAHAQLAQFLQNVAAVLAPGGKIVASVRLAEGNSYGSPGSSDRDDSRHEHWVYPGVSFFKLSTVEAAAAQEGLTVVVKPEYTALLTRKRPREYHDWLVLTGKPGAGRTASVESARPASR